MASKDVNMAFRCDEVLFVCFEGVFSCDEVCFGDCKSCVYDGMCLSSLVAIGSW